MSGSDDARAELAGALRADLADYGTRVYTPGAFVTAACCGLLQRAPSQARAAGRAGPGRGWCTWPAAGAQRGGGGATPHRMGLRVVAWPQSWLWGRPCVLVLPGSSMGWRCARPAGSPAGPNPTSNDVAPRASTALRHAALPALPRPRPTCPRLTGQRRAPVAPNPPLCAPPPMPQPRTLNPEPWKQACKGRPLGVDGPGSQPAGRVPKPSTLNPRKPPLNPRVPAAAGEALEVELAPSHVAVLGQELAAALGGTMQAAGQYGVAWLEGLLAPTGRAGADGVRDRTAACRLAGMGACAGRQPRGRGGSVLGHAC